MEKHRNKITIVIIISILLLVKFCVPKDSKDYKELYEKKSKEVEEISKKRLMEKDSLEKIISIREKETEDLKKSKVEYIDRIVKIKDAPRFIPKSIEEIAKYLLELYPNDTIEASFNRVLIDYNGSSKIVADLEEKIILDQVVLYQDSIIKGDSIIILNLDKDKLDLRQMLLSSEVEIQERIDLNLIANTTIKDLDKKRKVGKILLGILVPAGTIGGFILGSQLSK